MDLSCSANALCGQEGEESKELEITSKRVVVVGGGRVGCKVADYFSGEGGTVTVIEILEKMVPEMLPHHRLAAGAF